ncbi:hypothetical protein PCASD_01804 [Puccinia coronata f. sp. avenae]|uniref:Uncharacterized protein n=1 Tax=Puccinia coronata f. sp. avenae TaxID=200324 RepID=A0A2N5TDS4_9BASI|nr:hypothetical protein PCASD_12389 [Puccinia coronata f. sp. avenae]PLW50146.1 hypothetical protein PCASD_01804 [Puccinia coronata f. sp. avenae]
MAKCVHQGVWIKRELTDLPAPGRQNAESSAPNPPSSASTINESTSSPAVVNFIRSAADSQFLLLDDETMEEVLYSPQEDVSPTAAVNPFN